MANPNPSIPLLLPAILLWNSPALRPEGIEVVHLLLRHTERGVRVVEKTCLCLLLCKSEAGENVGACLCPLQLYSTAKKGPRHYYAP